MAYSTILLHSHPLSSSTTLQTPHPRIRHLPRHQPPPPPRQHPVNRPHLPRPNPLNPPHVFPRDHRHQREEVRQHHQRARPALGHEDNEVLWDVQCEAVQASADGVDGLLGGEGALNRAEVGDCAAVCFPDGRGQGVAGVGDDFVGSGRWIGGGRGHGDVGGVPRQRRQVLLQQVREDAPVLGGCEGALVQLERRRGPHDGHDLARVAPLQRVHGQLEHGARPPPEPQPLRRRPVGRQAALRQARE